MSNFDFNGAAQERFVSAAQYAYDCLLTEEHPDPTYYDIDLTISAAFDMLIEDGAQFNRRKAYRLAKKLCKKFVEDLIEKIQDDK